VFPGPALILEQKIDEVASIHWTPRFRKLFRLIFSSDLQVDGGYVGKCSVFGSRLCCLLSLKSTLCESSVTTMSVTAQQSGTLFSEAEHRLSAGIAVPKASRGLCNLLVALFIRPGESRRATVTREEAERYSRIFPPQGNRKRGTDRSGIVMVSTFNPALESDTDRFMAQGIRFKGQNFR
jgi:hypothetical protein